MGKPGTVLFVDDDPYVRKILGDYLQNAGLKVLSATNGEEALAVARNFAGDIQVLISDVMMPGMSGPELARELTQSRPGMKVLLISASAGLTPTPGEGWQFLRKPFPAQVLLEKIREMCQTEGAGGAPG